MASSTATSRIVWLATGGTIAGVAEGADNAPYRAGALSGDELRQRLGVTAPAGFAVEVVDVAQIDSKDMDTVVWHALVTAVQHHLACDDVAGLVITHGTDTLEETAYLLQRALAPRKPVAITGAMRPATAPDADGPRNLADALLVATHPGARGALVVFAGQVWSGLDARKVHSCALDAFAGGVSLARVSAACIECLADWPVAEAMHIDWPEPARWPVVDIVHSHAGARGAVVDALVGSGAQGLVVACTGNGTVHADLQVALERAMGSGVSVLRASRCATGGIDEAPGNTPWAPHAGVLTPAQARVELMLRLMTQRVGASLHLSAPSLPRAPSAPTPPRAARAGRRARPPLRR